MKNRKKSLPFLSNKFYQGVTFSDTWLNLRISVFIFIEQHPSETSLQQPKVDVFNQIYNMRKHYKKIKNICFKLIKERQFDPAVVILFEYALVITRLRV